MVQEPLLYILLPTVVFHGIKNGYDGQQKVCKHSIASESFCMNQVTFALQNIKIRLWQAVKILKEYRNFITRSQDK